MRLPERQLAVLEAASATDERTIDEIAAETGLKPETVTGAAFDLRDEGLCSVVETAAETLGLTDEGRRYVDDGLPETRLYRAGLALDADESAVSMGRSSARPTSTVPKSTSRYRTSHARASGRSTRASFGSTPTPTPTPTPRRPHSRRSLTARLRTPPTRSSNSLTPAGSSTTGSR